MPELLKQLGTRITAWECGTGISTFGISIYFLTKNCQLVQ
jgi:hypothetical protein